MHCAILRIVLFVLLVASGLPVGGCWGSMSLINRCFMPIDSGKCRGYFIRYGYDSETDDCYPFIYGGCRGNRNNFFTYEECMQRCYLKFK
ncbi:unnamed protein product [Rodentolepis nana]|uniref:BPTI/Kunitz inhibitor domain-containing protein n=1 Tax=Rodentolepis nana TaxID=102285 RepID=A0A0R3T105_RODNA|nr:unnamed protein product [Rodentolepis nana]